MSDNEYREYLLSCGFNEKEVEQKIKERDIMRDLYYKGEREPREITSLSYQMSQNKIKRDVERFLGC